MDNKKIVEKLIDVLQLFEEVNNKSFQGEYSGLNINEVHSIEYIGKNNQANVTGISNHLKLTRGALTKITKKLIEKGYVEEYRLETNKKEKYFRLTEAGTVIFNKHEINHKDAVDKDSQLFNEFSCVEKESIIKFLDTLQMDLKEKLNK